MAAMKAALAYAFALLGVVVALGTPAFADAELKKQLEQSNASYMEVFNKQDMAGIVAQYATGAIVVNPTGLKTDIAQHWESVFKAGISRLEATVDQAWPLGSGVALGMGKYRVTGKDQSGAAIDAVGLWTATYVQEGGKWKIRMTSVIPQPPPAK
jgi:ketosteroid isomerase-like protein